MPLKIRSVHSFKSTSMLGGDNVQHEHFLGEVAQVSEIYRAILVDFANLSKDDLVLVKRSDKSWTYAVVKEKENGTNPSVVVIVNSCGAFKKISMHHFAKYLRKVVDYDDSHTLMTDSVSSSHCSARTCDEVSVDYSVSMRTSLEVIEMSNSYHNDHAANPTLHHSDFLKKLIGELEYICSNETDKSGATEDSYRRRKGGHCNEQAVNQSQLPKSLVLKPLVHTPLLARQKRSQRHVTFSIHQDRELPSFRLNNEPSTKDKLPETEETPRTAARDALAKSQFQRQRSWSMEVMGMAEGILRIPKKKLVDLGLGEMSPQCNIRHTPRSINGRLILPPPFHCRREKSYEEVFHPNENVSISKKKLNELKMGDVIPQSLGQEGFESFQHALQSIHRRSSVFLPPVSGGGVVLH